MDALDETQKLIRRILRVNHAGEHGAISIYSAQIRWAKVRNPELSAWLEDTLAHEMNHRSTFLAFMPSRHAKPCRALYVWKYGGAILGNFTGMLGKTGILVCTAAVERTVHRHLEEQLA